MLVSNSSFYTEFLIKNRHMFSHASVVYLLSYRLSSVLVLCLLRVTHVNMILRTSSKHYSTIVYLSLQHFATLCFVYFIRHNYLKKFAMGVNKPSRPDLAPIRCKEMFRLEELSQVLAKPRYSTGLAWYCMMRIL